MGRGSSSEAKAITAERETGRRQKTFTSSLKCLLEENEEKQNF